MAKPKVVAVTQARSGSTRLPRKVLLDVCGQTLLDLHLDRILLSKIIDKLIVATTIAPEDDEIVSLAEKRGINVYRGSINDVLDRFYQALIDMKADYVVRLTSDCPLIDPGLIDKVISFTIDKGLDYGSNVLDPSYPDGQDIEVFKYSALERAWNEATLLSEREHVTPYIWKNSTFKGGSLFKSDNFEEGYSYGHLRMTVDEPKDLELMRRLVEVMGTTKTWLEYAEYLTENDALRSANESIKRNEGYDKSIKKDK